MRKLILMVISMFAAAVFCLSVNAIQLESVSISDKLSFIGFSKYFAQDDHADIARIVSHQAKYASEHNLEKLQELYTEDYFNSDGFDRELFFKMVKETWDAYPNIAYTSQVKHINIDNEFALVEVFETAMGETKMSSDMLADKGLLYSESNTVYCLKKVGRSWRIFSDYVVNEKDSLRFGDAKNINMDISAPAIINAGKEYTASLNMNLPKDSLILAAISNDPIIYPPSDATAVFKNLKVDGVLERVLNANTKNNNEFAVASIGITKAKVNKLQHLDISLTGIAFLRTRVNVIPKRNAVVK